MPRDVLTPWDNRMIFEIALAIDATQDVLARYQVDIDTYEQWLNVPAFQKQLEDYRAYVRSEGLSFKEKAKIQAEDLLNTSYTLIHHPDCPMHVKADLIKWTSKMAGLEPTNSQPSSQMGTAGPLLDESAIKKLTDGELEVHVMKIVSSRKDEFPLLEGEVVDGPV